MCHTPASYSRRNVNTYVRLNVFIHVLFVGNAPSSCTAFRKTSLALTPVILPISGLHKCPFGANQVD